jgi:hypothetical protein
MMSSASKPASSSRGRKAHDLFDPPELRDHVFRHGLVSLVLGVHLVTERGLLRVEDDGNGRAARLEPSSGSWQNRMPRCILALLFLRGRLMNE